MGAAIDTELMAVACACCRPLIRGVLRRRAGSRIYLARRRVERPQDVALAIQLLQTLTVAETRDALMHRLGCKRRKAYELITEALRERGKAAQHGQ